MKILLIEPFYTGSHKQWAEGYKKFSSHGIDILKLSGHFWKWRMHGGAVTLAREFNKIKTTYDLILCSDMLDLPTFQGLTRSKTHPIPFAIYFHENQLMYPWSANDQDTSLKRDRHYGFLNYTSALAADACLFNSGFHRSGFLKELESFLKQFPDHNELDTVETIRKKSTLLHLGMDLSRFDSFKTIKSNEVPIILWNHRWEHDKNPDEFFAQLFKLKEKSIPFQLAVLGQEYDKCPEIFNKARVELDREIIHWGYAEDFEEYAKWLWKADLLPVTSVQDFFGGSIVEAIYCETIPILPHRLAYPEHIPDECLPDHIYSGSENLTHLLERHLAPNTFPGILKDHVKRYDWSTMASTYDKELDKIKRLPDSSL